MSLIKSNTAGLGGSGSPGGALGSFFSHTIDQSLRFEDGDTANLKRDIASSGNRKTWTWSAWVKRGNLGSEQYLFQDGRSSSTSSFNFNSSDQLYVQLYAGAAKYKLTNQLFRDTSAWYHFVWRVDTTQSTAEDRSRVYVNGTQITSWSTEQNVNQNADSTINESGNDHLLGKYGGNSSRNFDGYMAEVNFIDGTSYGPDTFGETKDGVWVPKNPSVTYGNNGYRLEFKQTGTGGASSSTIGADTSGNDNHFTDSGLAAHDVVPDSPTNNFATLNPLYASASQAVLSEGNLKAATAGFSSSAYGYGATSTFAIPKDKKIYIEVEDTGAAGDNWFAGFATKTSIEAGPAGNTGGSGAITVYNRSVKINGTETDYGSSAGLGGLGVAKLAAGDILGCMIDGATGKVWFSRNGTYFKSPSSDNSGTTGDPDGGNHEIGTLTGGTTDDVFFVLGGGTSADNIFVNFGQDSTNVASANADGGGIGTFEYAPPTNYLALCANNMSDITIGPGQTEQADDNFNTVLYTGDSDNDVTVTNTFAADWVWLKIRESSGSTTQHFLQDIVRGFGGSKSLSSSSNGAEGYTGSTQSSQNIVTTSSSLRLVSADLAATNKTYVAWTWKAGGSASSNSNGSITSSVSANPDAGFSIGTFTGTGSAGTLGHGLSSAPESIILKSRGSTADWLVFHKDITDSPTHIMFLNATNKNTDQSRFNDTNPTSSVFSVGPNNAENQSGIGYVFYCFHGVEGYSKFGSYVGNGNADGTFVYTGFRPAWIIWKSETQSSSGWYIVDTQRNPFNEAKGADLYAQSDTAEPASGSGDMIDINSNGFKHRSSRLYINGSGATYIYLAFAEAPFKFANAR